MNYEKLSDTRLYVFAAHDQMQKSADTAYPFHQEPNFLWLTGVDEAGWILVVDTTTNRRSLLAPHREAVSVLFDGALTDEHVLAQSKVDEIVPASQHAAFWEKVRAQHDTVWTLGPHPYADHFEHYENPARERLWSYLEETFTTVHDCRKELAALRALKSPQEIAFLKEAIAVTIHGFEEVKKNLASTNYEYEIEASLSAAFRRTGASGHAYDPIVASGENACTLHYARNEAALSKEQLVLIDAGAIVDGYAADITRTYAVGAPTERQIAVHTAVEKAHRAIIALIQPGFALEKYQEEVDEIMKDALKEVGLLKNRDDTETYRNYFPHAISHGLGLDVHESLGGFKEFMPGMVLTVEPGIYIPEEGIGIRIEDDILVTEDGNENLSAALPTSL